MSDIENTVSINNTQKILLQLKKDFLEDLPERYALIEERILSLQKSRSPANDFDDLYRNVHSLKGSAGTYGVPIVTRVCHHLEDHLNLLTDDFSNLDDDFIDTCLAYIDLVKQACNLAINDDADSTAIKETLKKLRTESLKNKPSGLIVTGSSLMDRVCQRALENLSMQLTITDDSIGALEKLMHEKFDFIILSNEMSVLNGTAVTYALRASNSVNQGITVIMITTKEKLDFINELAPDHIIKKDQQLGENLALAAQQATRPSTRTS